VWWDRVIPPGQVYDRVIEHALDEARCVVVVWSARSVESDWVRVEADEGRTRGILVPVLFDQVKPPLAFRSLQTADLTHWRGDADHAELVGLVAAIERILGPRQAAPPPAPELPPAAAPKVSPPAAAPKVSPPAAAPKISRPAAAPKISPPVDAPKFSPPVDAPQSSPPAKWSLAGKLALAGGVVMLALMALVVIGASGHWGADLPGPGPAPAAPAAPVSTADLASPPAADTSLQAQIAAKRPSLMHCYRELLKQSPKASGTMRFRLSINTDGHVDGGVPLDAPIELFTHPGFLDCLALTMSAWEFPPMASQAVVETRFDFNPP
jgi:hypothetical protein